MRSVFRLPQDASLTAATETDLRLYVAHQKYNVRARRLAEKELRRRMTAAQPAFHTGTHAMGPAATPTANRPKGSLADIAWLGVILGAGALALHVLSWWWPF